MYVKAPSLHCHATFQNINEIVAPALFAFQKLNAKHTTDWAQLDTTYLLTYYSISFLNPCILYSPLVFRTGLLELVST